MTPQAVQPTWLHLAAGLLVSLVVGAAVTPAFQQLLNRHVGLAREEDRNRIPPSLTGHIERFFFTLVVAFDVSGAVPGMMTWVVAKMAANWNSAEARASDGSQPTPSPREILNRRFSALLTSTVSLTIAMIGGLVSKDSIPVGDPLVWTSSAVSAGAWTARLILRRKSKRSSTATRAA